MQTSQAPTASVDAAVAAVAAHWCAGLFSGTGGGGGLIVVVDFVMSGGGGGI